MRAFDRLVACLRRGRLRQVRSRNMSPPTFSQPLDHGGPSPSRRVMGDGAERSRSRARRVAGPFGVEMAWLAHRPLRGMAGSRRRTTGSTRGADPVVRRQLSAHLAIFSLRWALLLTCTASPPYMAVTSRVPNLDGV